VPDVVLVNQGTNDALCGAADDAVRAAAHAWLWGARAALGATPLLALVLPFGGFCAAPLRAAFADYQRGAEWLRAVAAAADAAGPTDGGDELSGASERSLDSNTSTDTSCESSDTNATEECRRFAVSPPRDERCVLLDLGREAADGLGGWAPRGPASADGIHPSGSKHRRLAALAEEALRAAPPLTPPTPRVRPPRRAARAVRVFGDSNLHALLDAEGAGYTCLVHVFLAGSAMGLAREDSHTGYRAALLDDLRSAPVATQPRAALPVPHADGHTRDAGRHTLITYGERCVLSESGATVLRQGVFWTSVLPVGSLVSMVISHRRVPRGDSVVLKFGQVDCDFVYYLKLVHDASLTFEAHLARSVERYFAFIDGALAAGHLRAQARGATAPEAPCSPRSPLPRLPTAGLPWCASGPVHRHALPDGRGGRPPAGGALLAAAHGKGGARGVP